MYDTLNPYATGTQPDFYARLAGEQGATAIVDIGCGTGIITTDLARQGYRMTGVDPSPAMLEIARTRPSGDRVTWIDGDAHALGPLEADLAVMTGHVAQFFLTDESWRTALRAVRDAVRTDGHLAFESRNPQAREWEQWTSATRSSTIDPTVGRIETWAEVHQVEGDIVTYANHYAFAEMGDELVSLTRLRFRTESQLTQSLVDAGFAVDQVFGGWDRQPVGPTSRELIIVATRTEMP